MGSDLCFINDNLHERYISQKDIILVADMFSECQEDVKLVELVSCGHATLNSHIKVVNGPFSEVLHASFPLVQIVIDQSPQIGPLIK